MNPIKPVLTYTGPVEGEAILHEVVADHFDMQCVPPEPSALARGLECSSALLDASMKVRITRQMIEAASKLRIVVAATTGADHIDDKALAERGIPLLTLKGQCEVLRDLTAAAEHSWLLLLACARRLRAASAHVLDGDWNRVDFPGIMLRGKILGIIGCGRIGSWMGRYAEAFCMRCIGYDPFLKEWPASIKQADLEELLSTADFVSLHVNLTEETRGMLGRSHFEQMKMGSIFINTSRGELIDEHALLDNLRSSRILAAGLDVLTGEPDVREHPLRKYALEHNNLIITPHIGGYSPDAVREVVRFSAERILRYFGLSV